MILVLRWGFRLSLDFFSRRLHSTRTAVARLPLRQLGFLVNYGGTALPGVVKVTEHGNNGVRFVDSA